jgi:hypothetical protein
LAPAASSFPVVGGTTPRPRAAASRPSLPRRRSGPRHVAWDAFVDVRGNRYSVPDGHAGRLVEIRIDFEGRLTIRDGERVPAEHRLRPVESGWAVVAEHHAALWEKALCVERRPLEKYEEVTSWS